jgi:hypothetical protein
MSAKRPTSLDKKPSALEAENSKKKRKVSNSLSKLSQEVKIVEVDKIKDGEEDDDNGAEGRVSPRNKPMQPPIFAENLAPYINRVYPRPSSEWDEDFIETLGALMANRGGFNCTNRAAIGAAGLGSKLDWFFDQYVELYEKNKHFEDLIDPWYVICEEWPQQPPNVFADALNAANMHVGGGPVANAANEPIQFNNGRNWFFQCPDRGIAERVAAFLHGRLNIPGFHTSVIDSRFLSYI